MFRLIKVGSKVGAHHLIQQAGVGTRERVSLKLRNSRRSDGGAPVADHDSWQTSVAASGILLPIGRRCQIFRRDSSEADEKRLEI